MNDEQLLRYSRHILLEGFDMAGQEALLGSTVFIVGAGGLGCPAALYLAASGVGHIILADDDEVELSNLQRQIAHSVPTLGEKKVTSLAKQLKAINPDISITCVAERITQSNCAQWVQQADVVLDCSDNFAIRFLLNKTCFQYRIPWISGAAVRTQGQVAVFDFRQENSACYNCLYDENVSSDQSCSSNGVLSPLVGIIGSFQAVETIKLLSGFGKPLHNQLLTIDLLSNQQRLFGIGKDTECKTCGSG